MWVESAALPSSSSHKEAMEYHEKMIQLEQVQREKVQLETEVPILSMVLTPQQFHGHSEHVRFFQDHFKIKGTEAADALVNVLKDPVRAKAL